MSDSDGPGDRGDLEVPLNPIIERIVTDPASVPAVALMSGFIGKGSVPDKVRIYSNLGLYHWVEVDRSSIVHVEHDEEEPLAPALVWVVSNATLSVRPEGRPPLTAEAYLSGRIAQRYLTGDHSVAAVAGGAPCAPSGQVYCPPPTGGGGPTISYPTCYAGCGGNLAAVVAGGAPCAPSGQVYCPPPTGGGGPTISYPTCYAGCGGNLAAVVAGGAPCAPSGQVYCPPPTGGGGPTISYPTCYAGCGQ
jgi:hypothetical protein